MTDIEHSLFINCPVENRILVIDNKSPHQGRYLPSKRVQFF